MTLAQAIFNYSIFYVSQNRYNRLKESISILVTFVLENKKKNYFALQLHPSSHHSRDSHPSHHPGSVLPPIKRALLPPPSLFIPYEVPPPSSLSLRSCYGHPLHYYHNPITVFDYRKMIFKRDPVAHDRTRTAATRAVSYFSL